MKGSAALIILLALAGCATGNSITPTLDISDDQQTTAAVSVNDNRMLWGEWTFYFNEIHDRVDVVPKRAGRFHLNALKFLEEYCADCLEITNVSGNGDGTINLTVQITHPFPDNPEYTGFDVKGIIMFKGSHEVPWWSSLVFPYGSSGGPTKFIVSWEEVGDPEVLNPDGYSVRWSPWWESGSELPIFNYWQGKYAKGTPTANVNAHLNFYTDEDRHIFKVDGKVSRTYLISLPPGPVIAGYAVEASWVLPDIMPVMDPVNDFPWSANQPEPYYFQYVVNNNEPVTDPDWYGGGWGSQCDDLWLEYRNWYDEPVPPRHFRTAFPVPPDWPLPYCITSVNNSFECTEKEPSDRTYLSEGEGFGVLWPDGKYRGVSVIITWPTKDERNYAYDIFDFTIDTQ